MGSEMSSESYVEGKATASASAPLSACLLDDDSFFRTEKKETKRLGLSRGRQKEHIFIEGTVCA
jgi:hypothetical protein